jgi:2-oxoglutarate ferredoxin oxidoreductase subunit delta
MKYWRVPLDSKEILVSRGIVVILEERCKGCGYCIAFCPRDVLELSPKYNVKGYHPPLVKKPDDCVNCHYCETICPDFAIYSLEIPPELPQQAVLPELATEVTMNHN